MFVLRYDLEIPPSSPGDGGGGWGGEGETVSVKLLQHLVIQWVENDLS